MKKILIHSIAFSPDGVSTAYLYNDIALAFKNKGYEVIVLTTTPHYNVVREELEKQPLKKQALGLYYRSSFHGIKVLHIPQKKFKSTFLRIIGFVHWHILSLVLGLNMPKIDFILSPSPPLTIGFINILIAKFKKAKVIYNVQEIYPDFLIEQGGLKSKFVIGLLKSLEKFIYNRSHAVVTIDKVFYNTIVDRFHLPEKLKIIPNFVDTSLYRPLKEWEIALDTSIFRRNDNLKVMYAGNIGHAQDWESLIEAAVELKKDPIEFYIIGEGVLKNGLIEKAKQYDLTKVYILPYQPRELMPQLLAFSDLQFIFMSKQMEDHGFPSKVYTVMACEKPLLVCSGKHTPIVNFLNKYNCSKIISVSDQHEKVNEIVTFLRTINKIQLNQMGKNGLRCIQSEYSKDVVTSQYIRLIEQL